MFNKFNNFQHENLQECYKKLQNALNEATQELINEHSEATKNDKEIIKIK